MRRALLESLNPLTKIAAFLPAMALLVVSRDPSFPLCCLALSALALLFLSRVPLGRLGKVAAGLAVMLPALFLFFCVAPLGAVPAADTPVFTLGPLRVFEENVLVAVTVSTKIAALFTLTTLGGLTTDPGDLVRALVQNARVPYRFGYAALASFRFVPRYRRELTLIQTARRARGIPVPEGAFGRLRQLSAALVPLLAGGVRHAERVGLSMDARGFGAHPTRTERTLTPLRVRDGVVLAAVWLWTLGTLLVLWRSGLLRPLILFD
ncbi:energy-coupling factor transporter transmembrane component T [Streptomyces sp. NPDC005438]|uniref:energy-coupling factor transporter transmembrane component T n=1 Tax=Streptomyces sp. NPDC005438 TaxID=3156880 RepID=UPI0033BA300B